MRSSFISFFVCLVAAGCALADESKQVCDPSNWAELIGQPVDEADAVPDPKRIVPPNTAVTQDYRPERTNVDVSDDGIIIRVWCG